MNEDSSPEQQSFDGLSATKREVLRLMLQRISQEEQNPASASLDINGSTWSPVSWGQQRLWFVHQFEGGGAAYNVPLIIRMRGHINEPCLQQSLDALMNRHEVLRATFANKDGELYQVVAPRGRFSLTKVDLRRHSQDERNKHAELHAIEEARGRFDLSAGPLIRGRLLRLGEDKSILLITLHHIICDEYSVNLLVRELGQLYTAFVEGVGDPLGGVSAGYSEFVAWQRRRLSERQLSRQLDYWCSRLADASPELALPLDRPRPGTRNYQGQRVAVRLDSSLVADIKKLASRHGMTMFMVLHGSWALFLSRICGQEDVVIGTPIANRRIETAEGIVGLLLNSIALRVQVDSNARVADFMRALKNLTLEAYDNQDIPFEKVVEKVRPERSTSRHPVFQVMFTLQETKDRELGMVGLSTEVEEGETGTAKFDLLLSLRQHDEAILGHLEYSTEILNRDTVERWVSCFTVMLRGIVGLRDPRIRDLPVLSREDSRLLAEFNRTDIPYSKGSLIHHLIEAQAMRTPDAQAVVFEHESLTYEELNSLANKLAHRLRRKGVGPDQRVGLLVSRGLEMIVGLLAIIKAGGAYVPLDPSLPIERLRYIFDDADPRLILTQRRHSNLPLVGYELDLIDLDQMSRQATDVVNLASDEMGLAASNLLYVIYTSGSTGLPKGIGMSHRSMVNLMEWHTRELKVSPAPRVLQFAALSFDVAFQEIVSTLCLGGTLILLDEWTRRDARAVVQLLSEQAVERLFIPPLMLQQLAECRKISQSPVELQLKEVIVAGEPLRISPEVVEFFEGCGGCSLHNHYGPTETHVVTALTMEGERTNWPVLPSIGSPVANTTIHILDSWRRQVPIGVVGEIYIGGANVARGYLNQAELTAERFVPDSMGGDAGERLFKTGDLGRWRSDGTIDFLQRTDYQVKIRGYRIELQEVEVQLARIAQADVAVVVREDIPGDKRLVAYVAGSRDSIPQVEDLRAGLKRVLPDYMVPGVFVMLESLPLTVTGKLNRSALPVPVAPDGAAAFAPPEGDIEAAVAEILCQILNVRQVARDESFFELGGHSLLVLRAIFRINEALGSNLDAVDVYKAPTVRLLANRIREGRAQECLVDLARESTLEDELPEDGAIRYSAGPPGAVLLTGATGFVGRFLLAQLLEESDSSIFCLVRAASQRHAYLRVKTTLQGWGLWRTEYESRIVGCAGDLRLPKLGVDQMSYQRLCREVDTIYHCGTSMNHLETYAMAKPANVGAARELLRLANSGRSKLINYVSTLGVFNRLTPGEPRLVDETSPIDQEEHPEANGYVASKWVAEKIFIRGMERGTRCNIFRIGLVWADTLLGRYDELQRGHRIIKSCLLTGVGIKDYHFEMPPTPVDYVARSVVLLSRENSQGGKVFHIASPRQMDSGFFESCNEILESKLKLVPLYDWICAIRRLHDEGHVLPVTPLMQYAFSMNRASFYEHQRLFRSTKPVILLTRTQQELDRAGVMAPVLNMGMLRLCISDMLTRDPDLSGRSMRKNRGESLIASHH